MPKTAIFPGSFDPFTAGHEDIVRRGLTIFDRMIVAVGYNIDKKALLTPEQRVRLISDTFKGDHRVEVIAYEGLTVDICQKLGVKFILRGVRSAGDFEYERSVDYVNRMLSTGIENVLLMTDPSNAIISSSVVRELISHGGDVTKFMPAGIDLKDYLDK